MSRYNDHQSPTSDATHRREQRRDGEPLASRIYPCDPDDQVARQVEDAAAADRAFFAENPQRKFRVRPAAAAEVAHFRRHSRTNLEAPPGFSWWIVAHFIHAKARCRVPFVSARHVHDEEEQARAIWEVAASRRVKDLAAWARERGVS
jgi:hypothetical protein